MNRRLLFGTIVLAWVLFSFKSFSQGSMDIALKQFDLEAYQLAIDNFQKVLAEDPENEEALYKLAEAYRLSNQNLEAIALFEKIVSKKNCEREAYLQYGHLLKSIGKYEDAKVYFEKYALSNSEIGNHFAESQYPRPRPSF